MRRIITAALEDGAVDFLTHRKYFQTYQLSLAQYGEILIAQVFHGKKLGDSQRCFDVLAGSETVRDVLRVTGADERSPLWPKTADDVRIEVRSKLSHTSTGAATVVHCKDSNVNGIPPGREAMTYLAVVIVHPGSRVSGDRAEEGRVVQAWLLTRDAAEQLRAKDGKEQYIRVSQLATAGEADGVIKITSLVAAAAELPLQFVDGDPPDGVVVRKTPGVCGGSACVGNTRIPVWLLSRFREMGMTDAQLLEAYPSLTQQRLSAAWEYAAQNPKEIAADVARQERGGAKKDRVSA